MPNTATLPEVVAPNMTKTRQPVMNDDTMMAKLEERVWMMRMAKSMGKYHTVQRSVVVCNQVGHYTTYD